MTTLQINDSQVESLINQYGQNAIIEQIKTFSPIKPREPQSDSKTQLINKLKTLKVIKPNPSSETKEAFEYLNKEFKDLGSIRTQKAKEKYFATKYKL